MDTKTVHDVHMAINLVHLGVTGPDDGTYAVLA